MLKDRTLNELEKDNYLNLLKSEKESLDGLNRTLISFKEAICNTLPQQYKEAFDVFLRQYGWHIRLFMSVNGLVPYINKGKTEVDKYFIRSIRLSQYEIKRKAINRFQHRKIAIQLAFKAHRRGEYELSIPAFLILSEGIFREMSNSDIFAKKVKEKDVFIKSLKENEKVSPLIPPIIEAVINGQIIGLSFSNDDDKQYPNVLHRNRIVHGKDYSYGTKVNSYKAISQFEFIISTVYDAFEKF